MENDKLIERFHKLDIYHFSASACNKPPVNWMFDYVYLNKEQRRKIVVGWNAILGTCCHEAIQAVLCHGQSVEDATAQSVMTYELYNGDQNDDKFLKFKEVLPDMIEVGVSALSEVFSGAQDERKIELELDGVVLPIIGYVDLSKDGQLAEIKTKAPRAGAVKASGERSWSKGSLPKLPSWEHTIQCAIYSKATGYVPNICYVSHKEHVTFTPSNCERLSEEALSYALEELRRKCILRQNLIAVSPDPKVLASIMEPDFNGNNSFFWADEYMQEAKDLFKT